VLVEVGGIVALLVAAGILLVQGFPTPADYDEGVYLASVDALRHGQELGDEIFTPQPAGFYELLYAGQAVFGATVHGGRTVIVVSALVALLAAFLLGRALVGVGGGIGAAALVLVAPPFATFASRISADLPAFALALVALVCVAYAGRKRRPEVLAGAAGVLLVAAVSVKVSALTAFVAAAALAWSLRLPQRAWAAAGGGAAAAAALILLVHADKLDGLWRGAVDYHRAARDVPGPGADIGENVERVLRYLELHTPYAWLVIGGAVAAVVGWRLSGRSRLWPLWLWAGVVAFFLVWHKPLHDNHMVALAVTLGLPAGMALGSALERIGGRRSAVVAALALVVFAGAYAQEWRRLHRNQADTPAAELWAVDQLRARTGEDELVITDKPSIAFLADRRIPGELMDAAALRFRSGFLTPHEVLDEIDRRRIRAVVAAREFRNQPAVMDGLRERFPTQLRQDDVTLFVRDDG
jgi:4-amino-4-deoxy-L-arabinose transferase-like glycosyltransferase